MGVVLGDEVLDRCLKVDDGPGHEPPAGCIRDNPLMRQGLITISG